MRGPSNARRLNRRPGKPLAPPRPRTVGGAVSGLPAGPGLMDALADPSLDPESLIMHTSIPGLSILPAGATPPNPQELLSRGTFRRVLKEMAVHFDVILIDAGAGNVQVTISVPAGNGSFVPAASAATSSPFCRRRSPIPPRPQRSRRG